MIALAADNASNNGTLVAEFSKLLPNLARPPEVGVRWDGSKAQIRCLPHVIHLAVIALLLGVKAVPAGTSNSEFSAEPMSVEEAEALALENNVEVLLEEKEAAVDPLVDLGNAVAKVTSDVFFFVHTDDHFSSCGKYVGLCGHPLREWRPSSRLLSKSKLIFSGKRRHRARNTTQRSL